MSLRNPQSIRYSLEIPELERTISYRALKVGEQKVLLTALELKEPKAVVNAIVDIVAGITFGELDLSKTPMHLVDYVFLKSFIKSSGAQTTAEYSCGGTIEVEEEVETEVEDGDGVKSMVKETQKITKPCATKQPLVLNLETAAIKYPENYQTSKTITIDDKMTIKLKLPDFESFKRLNLDTDLIGISDQYIYSGIDYILDGEDKKVPGVDFNFEEMTTWLNELDSGILEQISSFFETIPVLSLKVDVTCPKCGRKDGFELQGLEDFFL